MAWPSQIRKSWNLYSYVQNRTMTFVDRNGNWATPVHAQIGTFALQGYLSPGELKDIINRQYIMDSDWSPNHSFLHALRNGNARQSSTEASQLMWNSVASNMNEASGLLHSGGRFSDLSIVFLGDAIHTVQDYTSPMHTTASGELLPWLGLGAHTLGALGHYMGESTPDHDWSRIGWAIRLTMAAYMQANPQHAAANGLTEATFNKQAEQRISQYVDWFYLGTSTLSPGMIDAARQCALGNPAACDF